MPRFAGWLLLAAVVIALDQASKAWVLATIPLNGGFSVTDFFNLVLVFNRGAAFSFLSGADGWQRWFFLALAVGISAWIALMIRAHASERLQPAALALVLGGALGNAIDRVWHGAVVDFLDFHYGGWHFWAFNIADSAISLGVALLVLHQLFFTRKLLMVERVGPDSLVTLHYRIASTDNIEMVSTFAATPATLQLGNGELAPSLEVCLDGLEVGEQKVFMLLPEQAFGVRNPQMVSRVPRNALPPKAEPKLFEPLSLPAEDGSTYSALVLEMDEESVLLDFNHPLAGKSIRFEVKVIGVL